MKPERELEIHLHEEKQAEATDRVVKWESMSVVCYSASPNLLYLIILSMLKCK